MVSVTMNDFKQDYIVIEQVELIEDKNVTLYGIKQITTFDNQKCIKIVQNISTEKEPIEKLISMLSCDYVAPNTLLDIIEDYITDIYTLNIVKID